MAKLEVYRKGALVSTTPLTPAGVVLGRGTDAQVRLDDKLVSRHHARVAPGEGGWVLEDLKTRNGTHVNGLREFRRPLEDGDRIELGPFVIVFSRDAGRPEIDAGGDLSWAKPAPAGSDEAMSLDEATSLAAPKELARLRAEGRLRMQPHLLTQSGPREVVYPLRDERTLIGRGQQCQIKTQGVRRPVVAEVVRGAEGFEVRRRGWFHSMLVNGEKQRTAKLADGDTFELGEALFVFRLGA